MLVQPSPVVYPVHSNIVKNLMWKWSIIQEVNMYVYMSASVIKHFWEIMSLATIKDIFVAFVYCKINSTYESNNPTEVRWDLRYSYNWFLC